MATKFNTKLQILADFNVEADKGVHESWRSFSRTWSLSLPVAYAAHYGWLNLKTLGKQKINNCWDDLLITLNVEDTGFNSLGDVFKASPNPSL